MPACILLGINSYKQTGKNGTVTNGGRAAFKLVATNPETTTYSQLKFVDVLPTQDDVRFSDGTIRSSQWTPVFYDIISVKKVTRKQNANGEFDVESKDIPDSDYDVYYSSEKFTDDAQRENEIGSMKIVDNTASTNWTLAQNWQKDKKDIKSIRVDLKNDIELAEFESIEVVYGMNIEKYKENETDNNATVDELLSQVVGKAS